MVKYSCGRCGWKTNIKTHYRNHLKRKFPCKPILKDVSQKSLLDKLAGVILNVSSVSANVSANVSNVSANVSSVSANVSANVSSVSANVSANNKNINKKYICSTCFKSFNHRQSKYNHEKKYCRQKSILLKNQEELLQELDNIKKEKEQQSKFITEMQETHMREIGGLLKKVGDTINNNTYIKEQNIIINNYGQENVEYLSESYLKKLLHIHPSVAINLLIKNIHCHPKHPENHNIKITNKKLPYASIYKDGDWIVQDKKKVIKDIVSTSYNMIDENYSESMNINKNKKDTYEKFQKQYENKDKHLHKDLEKTAEILIMNNSNK